MLKLRQDVHWYCPSCDKQAMTAIKADWEIEERCAAYLKGLDDKLVGMQASIDKKADKATTDNLAADVMFTKKLVEGANADIAKLSDRIELVHKESVEIEKRKKNVIIKGLPEDAQSTHYPGENRADVGSNESTGKIKSQDESACIQLFNSIGIDVTPKSVHRLDKKKSDGKPRPVKVVLHKEEDKKRILRNGPHVRNVDSDKVSFDPGKVFICPDIMT